jgi:D-alanyl-D-alanine carboxypeptidase
MRAISAPAPGPLDRKALTAAVGGLPSAEATTALVVVREPAGQWAVRSAQGLLREGAPSDVPGAADERFRIGSISRVFLAVVVLQLADEGRLELAGPVRDLLPELIPERHAPFTVRQLLDHTSGLADDSDVRVNDTSWFLRHRFETFTAEQIVALALSRPLSFAPGTVQQATRANYVLAGMLAERVTGLGHDVLIRERVLKPLGLHATTLPGTDPQLPGPHTRGYELVPADAGSHWVDVTEHNPSMYGAAGSMISTPADLDRFLLALFRGELLAAAGQAELFRVPDLPYLRGGRAFCSAGLESMQFPNGVLGWGMPAVVHGCISGVGATRDLRRSLVYVVNPTHRGDTQLPPIVQRIAGAVFA